MRLPSPGFLLDAFAAVCRRFPVVMFCTAVGIAACFVLVEHGENHFFTRLWMVCQLGLPLLTGLAALAESKQWNASRSWLLQGLGVAALAAYFFVLDPGSDSFQLLTMPRYAALLIVAHLLVAVAPYINREPVADFWEYNKRLFTNLIVGGAFTAILYLGLSAAMLAIDQLFDLKVEFPTYARLFVLLAGGFNTTYFLFHFPKNYHFEDEGDVYNSAFRNLCKFILIPIVGLYFLILYAYGAKILITWNLPHGWVASLVIGFSVAGIFTYLLNYMLPQHDDNPLVHGYRRWFWWVVLPMTVLLFVGIGRRIADYGVTEQRYLVAHTGLWLAAMCLYFLFSKTDNIKFVPLSLGLFTLLYAFGPLSAFAVSERSQAGILKDLLERTGHFKNGKIVQDSTRVIDVDVQQIESVLRYFEYRDNFAGIRDWLPMSPDDFPASRETWNKSRRIMNWAGIRRHNPIDGPMPWSAIISPENKDLTGVDVSGYRTYFRADNSSNTDSRHDLESGRYLAPSVDGRALEYCEATASGHTVLDRFEWPAATLRQWRAKAEDGRYVLPTSELRVVLPGKKNTACVVIEELVIEEHDGKLSVTLLTGGVFLK